jgi:hypothetical protein
MLNRFNEEYTEAFKGWTFLNFHKKIFYINKDGNYGTPANQYQDRFFKAYFVEMGKTTCSFKEFRDLAYKKIMATPDYRLFSEFYDFNQKRQDSINYGSVKLTSNSFYHIIKHLEDKQNDPLEFGFSVLLNKFNEIKNKEFNQNISKEDQEIIDSYKAIKILLKNLNK